MSEGLCAPIANEKVKVITSPKGRPVEKEQVFLQCGSVETAVAEVIAKEDPDILALGEAHPDSDDGSHQTTMKLFAARILPVLVQSGRNHLIIENFYCDRETDQAIEAYLLTGKGLDALLNYHLFPDNNINRFGLQQILQTARALREKGVVFRIYGGGLSRHDRENSSAYDNFLAVSGGKKLTDLMSKLSLRTRQKVSLLQREGVKKIVTYNGAQHNDIINITACPGISFGARLKEQSKGRYVEIDIMSPEFMDKGYFENYDYPEYESWIKVNTPADKVTLIKRGGSAYTLLLPAGQLRP